MKSYKLDELTWKDVLSDIYDLMRDISLGFVKKQRWFWAKDDVSYNLIIEEASVVMSMDDSAVVFMIAKTSLGDKAFIPVVLVRSDENSVKEIDNQNVFFVLVCKDSIIYVIDAVTSSLYCNFIMSRTYEKKSEIGGYSFESAQGLKTGDLKVVSTSSNSISIMKYNIMMKTYRHLEKCSLTEGTIIKKLNENGFFNTPYVYQEVWYRDMPIVLCEEYIEGSCSAWEHDGSLLNNNRKITNMHSNITARMHKAMEQMEVDDLKCDHVALKEEFERIIKLLNTLKLINIDNQKKNLLVKTIEKEFLKSSFGTCHGDFHLGQILVKEDFEYVIDFEGEPIKLDIVSSPIKDVASLLRSYSYLAKTSNLSSEKFENMRAKFLQEYYEHAKALKLKAVNPYAFEVFDRLVRCLEIEKCMKEIIYEAKTRPEMVDVPVSYLAYAFEKMR